MTILATSKETETYHSAGSLLTIITQDRNICHSLPDDFSVRKLAGSEAALDTLPTKNVTVTSYKVSGFKFSRT